MSSVNVDFRRVSSEGQMSENERRYLYHIVLNYGPRTVCEVGTWRGGGSTYYIASALLQRGEQGLLYTCEVDVSAQMFAIALYSTVLSYLSDHVALHLSGGRDMLARVAASGRRIGMLFLDGSDDPAQTIDQLYTALPAMDMGAVVAAHDWDGVKTERLRPLLDGSPAWESLGRVDNLAAYVRRSPWRR